MNEENAIWDYANITKGYYESHRAFRANVNSCVLCAKPKTSLADDLCEDHRLSYDLWLALREIGDMPDSVTKFQAEKIFLACGENRYNPYKIKDIYDLLIEYKAKKEGTS